jgi:hypothetical protein
VIARQGAQRKGGFAHWFLVAKWGGVPSLVTNPTLGRVPAMRVLVISVEAIEATS